jgi:hypothetical protein
LTVGKLVESHLSRTFPLGADKGYYQNIQTNKSRRSKAIVFVGTPGVVKSMLVVLFVFYKVLRQEKFVVLMRKL